MVNMILDKHNTVKSKKVNIIFIMILILLSIKYINYYKYNKCVITQYGLDDSTQCMFYTINYRNKFIVIDGGTPDYTQLVREVIEQNGGEVDAWIITHPHPDHIGAFLDVLEQPHGIDIDEVYTVDIDSDYYHEIAKDVDGIEYYDRFLKDLELIQKLNYVYIGDTIDICGLEMEVFNAYSDGIKAMDVGFDLPNATSMVFKITNNKESILFCADCEDSTANIMLRDFREELSADYVQVAHHGQNLSEEFYDVVDAKGAFFDAPKWLREEKKYGVKDRINLYKEKEVQTYTWNSLPNSIVLK